MHTILHMTWGVAKHLAFGYVVYSIFCHLQGSKPRGQTVIVLLFGTMFPDLIDKVLVVAGTLEYGRGFGHSLFTVLTLSVVAGFITRRVNRADIGNALAIGYLSHAPVDMYGTLLTGSAPMDTAFLFWPVLVEYSIGIPTPELPVSRTVIFGGLMVAAFGLWLYHRMPVVSEFIQYAFALPD